MVTMGKHPQHARKMMEFTISNMGDGAYNGFIGRPALSKFEVVVSLIHLKMRFPTRTKEQTEVGSLSRGPEGPKDWNVCTLEVLKESPKKGRPHEEIQSIPFDERGLVKVFKIGTTLGAEHEAMLIRVLREYQNIFAWELKDISGVDPEVSFHLLCVGPHYKSVSQKKRTFSDEKGEAIREEVEKLQGAKAIRELLRMCTYFTCINNLAEGLLPTPKN
ncbi:hypothetical protein LIER_10401 [Lithospermum erythrorhizon]|uniref:Reverse transcriptase domain-containing protein n=1 Tax=Lithospermum erythrorhizon TaxID=34254 RepID=A0AAV3PJ21_LITER